jgi:hypothetical protein
MGQLAATYRIDRRVRGRHVARASNCASVARRVRSRCNSSSAMQLEEAAARFRKFDGPRERPLISNPPWGIPLHVQVCPLRQLRDEPFVELSSLRRSLRRPSLAQAAEAAAVADRTRTRAETTTRRRAGVGAEARRAVLAIKARAAPAARRTRAAEGRRRRRGVARPRAEARQAAQRGAARLARARKPR